jgi:hypothetical protein
MNNTASEPTESPSYEKYSSRTYWEFMLIKNKKRQAPLTAYMSLYVLSNYEVL